MGMHSVARVDDGQGLASREQLGGSRIGMAEDEAVRAERCEVFRGIRKRLALLHAGGRNGQRKGGCTQPADRIFERDAGAGRGLVKEETNGLSGEELVLRVCVLEFF